MESAGSQAGEFLSGESRELGGSILNKTIEFSWQAARVKANDRHNHESSAAKNLPVIRGQIEKTNMGKPQPLRMWSSGITRRVRTLVLHPSAPSSP